MTAFDPQDPPHASPPAQHVRARRGARAGVGLAVVVAAALIIGGSAAVTASVVGEAAAGEGARGSIGVVTPAPPAVVSALPAPSISSAQSPDICDIPAVGDALAAGDDEAAVRAAGGGEAFRAAVVARTADCVRLDDANRVWVVSNKLRPYQPIDVRPEPLSMPEGVRSLEGGALRTDAAVALSAMVSAARDAGVGEIALESGFRSYQTQQGSYGRQVSARGAAGADQVSARPGFSEHQSGLAGDVVACNGSCGSIDDLAESAQGRWIEAHAWEYGWIVRYETGRTDVTGYLPEPWHLRFIGVELAGAYHQGDWHTLEEFFSLPPAPDYAD